MLEAGLKLKLDTGKGGKAPGVGGTRTDPQRSTTVVESHPSHFEVTEGLFHFSTMTSK